MSIARYLSLLPYALLTFPLLWHFNILLRLQQASLLDTSDFRFYLDLLFSLAATVFLIVVAVLKIEPFLRHAQEAAQDMYNQRELTGDIVKIDSPALAIKIYVFMAMISMLLVWVVSLVAPDLVVYPMSVVSGQDIVQASGKPFDSMYFSVSAEGVYRQISFGWLALMATVMLFPIMKLMLMLGGYKIYRTAVASVGRRARKRTTSQHLMVFAKRIHWNTYVTMCAAVLFWLAAYDGYFRDGGYFNWILSDATQYPSAREYLATYGSVKVSSDELHGPMMCLFILSVLAVMGLASSNDRVDENVALVTNGIIKDIDFYSSERTSLNVTVVYLGYTKVFKAVNGRLGFHVKAGDFAVVRYHPEKIKKSELNVSATIALKQQGESSGCTRAPEGRDPNAVFRITSVLPRFERKELSYDIMGELSGGKYHSVRMVLEKEISFSSLAKFSAGAVVPCYIQESDSGVVVELT